MGFLLVGAEWENYWIRQGRAVGCVNKLVSFIRSALLDVAKSFKTGLILPMSFDDRRGDLGNFV